MKIESVKDNHGIHIQCPNNQGDNRTFKNRFIPFLVGDWNCIFSCPYFEKIIDISINGDKCVISCNFNPPTL